MTLEALVAHTEAIREILAVPGPRSRKRVILLMGGFGLSESEADEVIAHGIETAGW